MIPLAETQEAMTENFDEALALARSRFAASSRKLPLEALTLAPDGTMTLPTGEAFPISRAALPGLVRFLGIPLGYAETIADDLLLLNYARQKREKNQEVLVMLSGARVVANIVATNKAYPPAKTEDLLQELRHRFPDSARQIRISDVGIDVDIIDPALKPVDAQPADTTLVGRKISNSEVYFRGAKAEVFTRRVICANGASMSSSWGAARWPSNYRISYQAALATFWRGVDLLKVNEAKLAAAYAAMPGRGLRVGEFAGVWRSLAAVLSSQDSADLVLGVSTKERQAIFNSYREKRREEDTDVDLYAAFNGVTAHARVTPFAVRRELESLGGSLLDLAVSRSGT